MKKILSLGLLLALCSAPLYAQQSAKNAVQISSLNLVSAAAGADGYPGVGDTNATAVLATQLRTSQQKDLVIGVSLECGLFTRTLVRSKGGNKDESTADATVQVYVVRTIRTEGPII